MANSVTPLLNADEIKLTRLRQLTDVFAMADSTLAGHRVTCEVMGGSQSGNNSPAWSQGGKITFNSDAITEVSTVEGLVKVNGLNYHELAHILYTPSGGDLVRMVNSNGWYTAFNVLEDQRIETLLVAKYPTVAPYLVATVAEYFMETNPATHGNAWPYLVGRAYLPASMRDYFEAASKTDPKMRSTMMLAGQIVGEYKFMDVNSGNKRVRALELIEKFHNIIGTHQQFSPFGHERATQAAQGGSAPGTGPRNGSAAAQAAEQDRKDEIQDAADKEAAGDTGAPGAEGESGSEGGEGGDSPKDGAQGEGDSDTDGEGGSGAGSGSGITTPKPSDTAKVKEMLKAAGDQAKMTPTVADDVRRQREAMSMGKRFRGTLPAPTRSESRSRMRRSALPISSASNSPASLRSLIPASTHTARRGASTCSVQCTAPRWTKCSMSGTAASRMPTPSKWSCYWTRPARCRDRLMLSPRRVGFSSVAPNLWVATRRCR